MHMFLDTFSTCPYKKSHILRKENKQKPPADAMPWFFVKLQEYSIKEPGVSQLCTHTALFPRNYLTDVKI